jgi:putative membrane protein
MRKLLRFFAITLFSLWVTNQLFPEGLKLIGGIEVLIKAGVAMTFANLIVRPVVNLLLLPFNLITLGAFRWIVNVFILYAVVRVVTGVNVMAFQFVGFSYQGFTIPEVQLSVLGAYLFLSFFLSLVATLLFWLFR